MESNDKCVFKALEWVTCRFPMENGADIGCESGVFPAMQLYFGIRKVAIYEIRPIEVDHPSCEIRLKNLLENSQGEPRFNLVTCLSTLEHVGLGRYGDALSPQGDIQLANALKALLKPGGILILSVPLGRPCILYNAARIYSSFRLKQVINGLKLLRVYRDRTPMGWARFFAAHLQYGRCGWQPVFVLQNEVRP